MKTTKTAPPLPVFVLLAITTLVHGCGKGLPAPADLNPITVHKIDIPQGNIVDQRMLASLRLGMDKRQVSLVMGTPMIEDPFHPHRWDYIYSLEPGGQPRQQRLVSLYFDENDELLRVEGDVVVQLQPRIEEQQALVKETVDVPARTIKPPGLFGRLTGAVGLPVDTFMVEQPEQNEQDKPGFWSKLGKALWFGGDDEPAGENTDQPEADSTLSRGAPSTSEFHPAAPSLPERAASAKSQATENPAPAPDDAETPVSDEEAGLFDGLIRSIQF